MKHETLVAGNPEKKPGAASLKNKAAEGAKSSVCLFGTQFYDRVRPPSRNSGASDIRLSDSRIEYVNGT